MNKHFKDLLKERGITFFTGENGDIKCSLAERFNSTLQSKMWRYFTHANTYTYIDVLQDLIHSYNHTFHDTLRGRPVDVNRDNADRLFYHLYERVSPEDLKRKEKQEEQVPIKKGQKAQILRTKKTFNRGYEPNWTEEIFTVKKPDYVRGYELEDALKEPIKGWFYRQQVATEYRDKLNGRLSEMDIRHSQGNGHWRCRQRGVGQKADRLGGS